MSLGRAGGLSGAALRALPFIRSGVERGLSSRAIQDALSAGGMGVRRTELLAAIRGVTGEAAAADRLRFVRKDRRPDPERLAPALTKTLREYAFVAELRGTDPVTGDPVSRYVTVSSSRVPTVAELEEAAASLGSDPDAYLPLEIDQVLIRTAVRSGAAGRIL